jgi:hypothetical protein
MTRQRHTRFLALAWAATSLAGLVPTPALAAPGTVFHEAGTVREQPNVVGATIDSTAWINLQLDWLRRLPHPPLGETLLLGGGLELPLLLWAQTATVDTARVAARGAWLAYRWQPFGLIIEANTRIGSQHNYMGTLVAWDAGLSVEPGLRWRRGGIGLLLAVRQGLSTHVSHSDYVKAAFADRYPSGTTARITGPRAGWIAFPGTRFPLGLVGSFELGRVALQASAGLVLTATGYDTGLFDTMAVGVWPFFASIGATTWF